jgi:hypothetical protein
LIFVTGIRALRAHGMIRGSRSWCSARADRLVYRRARPRRSRLSCQKPAFTLINWSGYIAPFRLWRCYPVMRSLEGVSSPPFTECYKVRFPTKVKTFCLTHIKGSEKLDLRPLKCLVRYSEYRSTPTRIVSHAHPRAYQYFWISHGTNTGRNHPVGNGLSQRKQRRKPQICCPRWQGREKMNEWSSGSFTHT